jgi:hypothetical protein
MPNLASSCGGGDVLVESRPCGQAECLARGLQQDFGVRVGDRPSAPSRGRTDGLVDRILDKATGTEWQRWRASPATCGMMAYTTFRR